MMQVALHPHNRDLVLIGGGHSHAIALRLLYLNSLLPAGTRLTLIGDTSHAPYSGMLPGYVAGYYSFDETHIDLRRLASCVGAQFYLDTVIGLDLEKQRVLCAHRPPVYFDYLSIDVGSTPAVAAVPGALDYAIAAKPVPQFLQAWNQILTTVEAEPQRPQRLAIVGGGAGGVELALNMQRRLESLGNRPEIHLFHGGNRLLPGHAPWVGQQLQTLSEQRGIQIHLRERVAQVNPDGLTCESGSQLASCDRVFWVTQAAAPAWIRAAGLDVDEQGFMLVDATLRSPSHPQVFGAGDVATMQGQPRPKAGVFAVRQGPPLAKNLSLVLRQDPPQPFVPQRRILGLIGTADKQAIASWGPLGLRSRWLWRWKDRIDRAFMEQFEQLTPTMGSATGSATGKKMAKELEPLAPMVCAGCGSKLGGPTLTRALQRVATEFPQASPPEGLVVGLDDPDDAAVMVPPSDRLLVQSVDYFRSPLSDPFIFGQITANHCLGDLYAMGAVPHSALAIATLPYGTPAKNEETLFQVLAGTVKALQANDTTLIGGHSTTGPELALGLTVNGWVEKTRILRKSGMVAGQALVLSKPLGTGTLLAANLQGRAKGRWLEAAIAMMLQSNRTAADIFRDHGATALTDVTGFGLLGHLLEMVRASGVGAEIELGALPSLPGALIALQQGLTSSLAPENATAAAFVRDRDAISSSPLYSLLFDPQTAGGLLASVPLHRTEACLSALQAAGYGFSCQIGSVTVADGGAPISLYQP
ncbi:MAG: selenide, water dikinase SelD [Cyanobacteria bacterium J06641_5]